MLKKKSGDAYQWYTNGLFQFERKNYGEAAYAFMNAYEREPSEEAYKIYTFKSKRLYELELHQKELTKLEEAKSVDLDKIAQKFLNEKTQSVEDSRQWFLKAKFNYWQNNIDQALSELKIALILNSQNNEAKNLLKEIEEASKIFEIPDSGKEEEPEKTIIEPLAEEKVIINDIGKKQVETNIIKSNNEKESTVIDQKKESLKLVSSKDKVTLNDHLSTDKKIIIGLYDLPKSAEKTYEYIKNKFDEADKLLKEKKFNQATLVMEEAYLNALEYNKKDLRALYYLYLISEKKQDIKKMQLYFFNMIDVLNTKNFKQEEYYIKTKELVDSLLFSMIIQGAYNAWILRNSDEKLKIDSLIQQGYLSYVKKIVLEIGYQNRGKLTWYFSHIHSKEHFKIKNKTVISDIYGVSPLMADEFFIEEQ